MEDQQNSHQMLSVELSDRILDLQYQVQSDDCTRQSLCELLSAYCEAISFYNQLKDSRFTYYQHKIKALFASQDVARVLSLTDNKKSELKQKVNQAARLAACQAEIILARCEQASAVRCQRINHLLQTQKQGILERVKRRSNSKTRKSTRSDIVLRELQERLLVQLH